MAVTEAPERFRKADKYKQAETVRVAVIFFGLQTDLVLPTDVSVASVIQAMLPVLQERREALGLEPAAVEADEHGGKALSLIKLDGQPLDREQTLAACGVVTSDLLVLQVTNIEVITAPVVENVSSAVALENQRKHKAVEPEDAQRFAAVTLVVAAVAIGGLLVRAWQLQLASGAPYFVPGAVAAGLAALLVVSGLLMSWRGPGTVSVATLLAAFPLIAVAGFTLVPSTAGAAHVLLAAASVFVFALGLWWVGAVPRGVALALVACSAGIGVLAFVRLIWHVPIEYLAVATLALSTWLLHKAKDSAWMLAPLPLPDFPTATGQLAWDSAEDLAEDALVAAETNGTPTREQIVDGAAAANTNLIALVTSYVGFIVASAIVVADPRAGRWAWQLALIAVVTGAMVLGGRMFTGRTQSMLVVAGALAIVAGVGIRYSVESGHSWMSMAVAGAIFGLGVLGLVLVAVVPNRKFSAPVKRVVEMIEYLLLAAIVPLAVYLLNLLTLGINR